MVCGYSAGEDEKKANLSRVCLFVVNIKTIYVHKQGVFVSQLASRHISVVTALRLILCLLLLLRLLDLLPHHITSLQYMAYT